MSLEFLGRQKRFKDNPARLLHVGALRLDESAVGLPGLPEKLRHLQSTSAHAAMMRVFDAAIEHRVDVVVFSGGFPDPTEIGFRGLALFYDQCRRLLGPRIAVVTNSNPAPTDSGFDYLRPPANVFFLDDFEGHVVSIGNASSRNRLDIGTSVMESNARLRVVTSSHPTQSGELQLKSEAEYIALGSQANPIHWPRGAGDPITWDAGSPQGRSLQESGPHGAMLVTLGRGEKPVVQPIACDVVRHHDIWIEVASGTTWEQLHHELWAHGEQLRTDHSVPAHIVHWTVQYEGSSHRCSGGRATRFATCSMPLAARSGHLRPDRQFGRRRSASSLVTRS